MSEKIKFKLKMVKKRKRDKEDNYIMIKSSIHQEDITAVNMYAHNSRAPKYIKQKLTELKEKEREREK